MVGVVATVLIVRLMVLLAMAVAALLAVRHAGVSKTAEYMRGGIGFRNLLRGEVDEQDSGSLVSVREGLRASVGDDGKVLIRGTRTLARDEL